MTQVTHKESDDGNQKGALGAGGDKAGSEEMQVDDDTNGLKSGKTLYHSVVNAMDAYFSHLDGEHSTGIYHMVMAQVESALLASVMKQVDDNQSKAAKCLGISRGTLLKKLTLYKITPSRKRGKS